MIYVTSSVNHKRTFGAIAASESKIHRISSHGSFGETKNLLTNIIKAARWQFCCGTPREVCHKVETSPLPLSPSPLKRGFWKDMCFGCIYWKYKEDTDNVLTCLQKCNCSVNEVGWATIFTVSPISRYSSVPLPPTLSHNSTPPNLGIPQWLNDSNSSSKFARVFLWEAVVIIFGKPGGDIGNRKPRSSPCPTPATKTV